MRRARETLDISEDTGTPVSEDYRVPFMFTGEIEKVVIEPSKSGLPPVSRWDFPSEDP